MADINAGNPALPSPKRRPNNGLPLVQPLSTEYRTTCKVCRCGIFGDAKTVWGRGQHLGLLHKGCADRVGAAYTEQPAQRPAAAAPLRSYGGMLTERQQVMVQLLADGLTTGQIGQHEGVTTQTAYNTLWRARERLGAADFAELVAIARRRRLIRPAS